MPIHLVDHPLVHDTLAELRHRDTAPEAFRRLARRLSMLLAVEALRDLQTLSITVPTPISDSSARRVSTSVVVVPVLRAGLGMLDAVLELLPTARVGHIGLQRDEATALPSQYYSKLPPDLDGSLVLVVDPMLATGGSAVAALRLLHEAGARDVRLVCIVAAPEGVQAVEQAFPDVRIFTPAIDLRLNERKYIVPGLGDFGDRLYGTF